MMMFFKAPKQHFLAYRKYLQVSEINIFTQIWLKLMPYYLQK